MELWDGYHQDGNLAGVELIRGEPIPAGLYHLVCEVLVRHVEGTYLLMERDPAKPGWGGYFEAIAGGSALKGEDAISCAARELREETGITALSLEEIGKSVSHNTIYHNYLCVTDCEKSSVTLQAGETVSYRWVTEAEFAIFVNSGEMIPTQREHYLGYLTKMGYIQW